MASGQRAFAQKLNKQGAAEVRKQVSSAYIGHGSLKEMPKSISGGSLASNVSVPISEVVEPLDFEDVMQLQQASIDRDPMRHLLEFPHDDVEVNLLPRKCRTIAPVVPEHGAETDLHIRDCINVYTSDYHIVHRRYQGYSSSFNAKTRSIEVIDSHKSLPHQEFETDIEETSDQDIKEKNKRTSIHMNDTPRGSWASSIFDLKNSQADALLPNILEHRHPDEIDRNNEFQRRQERHEAVFTLYPLQHDDDFLEKRSSENPPSEHFGHRIVVKCLQLKLELEVEPIFASMALYDAKERKKISENFYFDLVPEGTKKMLSSHIPYQDISTLSRSCVFSITYPSSDVFLVVKLEKVLQQGDITECAEPYMKDEKSVNKDKVKTNSAYFCEKLGQYRMPFAWTAIYLMNIVSGNNSLDSNSGSETASASGSLDRRSSFVGQFDSFRKKSGRERDDSLQRRESLERQKSSTFDKRTSWSPEESSNLDNFRPVTLTVSSFFKQEADRLSDDDLYKFLADLKRPTNILKKLKCIPGTLKLDISPCPEEPKYCLSPELYKIDPYPDDKGRPTKEIVEFPPREVFVPYTNFRNLLYVYPKSLNFANRQGHARNIAVKVQILAGENDTDALPVIFGKSSCPEYQNFAFSTVTYHSKSPDFYEEVKMKLPAKIADQFHLLFTFYHISCQKKAEMVGPLETPIGYTWLPLLKDGRLLAGEFCLPVSLEPPPSSYSMIMPDVLVPLPGMKWVDNHKSLFTVSVEATSSIHTQDKYLDEFLKLCHMAEEQQIPARIGEAKFESQLKNSIADVAHASPEPLVRFLTLVLDKLIYLMVRPPIIGGQIVNMAQSVFDSISQIARSLQSLLEHQNDIHGRNSLLVQYIQYSCTLPYPETPVVKSPSGPLSGYATMGRPTSLQVTRPYHARSSSDPDMPGSNPTSPDQEYPGTIESPGLDRIQNNWNKQLVDDIAVVKYVINPGVSGRNLSGSRISTVERPVCPRQPADMAAYYQKVKKLVHEQVALQWVVSSGSTRETALTNAWFFFELMIKSMADHLARTGKFFGSRKVRFPPHFMEDVTELVDKIIRDIVERYHKDVNFIRSVNTSLAFFLYDALSMMDRGYIFNLIKNYCRMVSAKITTLADPTSLSLLKLDFMRIICSHEHYVALNLPFGTPTTPSAPVSPSPSVASTASYASNSTLVERSTFAELTTEFRQQHFLAGLVLSDLVTALESHNTNVHARAINVTRNLLFCHDTDSRFNEPDIKARVSALYLPLIIIVIDSLPQLFDPYTEVREQAGDMQTAGDRTSHEIDESVAMAIAASSVYTSRLSDVDQSYDSSTKGHKSALSGESSRNLLICFIWVIKNINRRTLRQLWSEMSMSRLNQVLDVLFNCISNFEYKGRKSRHMSQQIIKKSSDMKSKLENAILGSGSARSEMMSRRRQGSAHFYLDTGPPSPATMEGGRLRWRKDQTQWKQEIKGHHVEGRSVLEPQVDYHVEGNLSTEVAMTVLDMLELITQIVSSSDSMQSLLSSIMRVLLHMMITNQSTVVLQSVFATQRSIVSRFPELLFEEDTEQCADLSLRLLRHCSSSMSTIRTQASASLYLLMRQNYEKGNNFARVKMQVTMSLSSLVGQSHTFNEEYLRKSLKTILTYAEADVELQETTFPSQVKDLVFNLHMILSDTVKMKEFSEDPEMLLDLMYRIAKGYQNSPDLRLTWLQNMAQKHTEKANHAEAALCLVHSAGLVAEYLNMLEDRPHLPVGCVVFQRVSFNVLEESAVSDDVVSPDEEGICTGKFFTENGLVGLLEQAATSFNTAGLFEAVNEVYKVLLPIHEHNRDFKKLGIIHGKLQEAFNQVIKQEGKRIFGTYFRVGFYGSKFGDLDGEEYIYKEQSITKLSEISHRLEGFYSDRFGQEFVETIKDSNTVERDKLNPEKAYIQITYVEPYFDAYEQRERLTYFDKNYNLKRFMYATPFTMDGRAHGELQDQYKRKTIVTTERSFPYVKTRISVIKREQIILSPIEVAIEDVQKKTKELALALFQEPPDPKMLQMVLQGCIGTTVNQGPLEVAQVFLCDVAEGRSPPTKHHNKLRLCFKDFLKKCSDALHRNKSLIHADQREYQRELERNYHAHREKLTPLITSNSATLRRPKHKKESGSKKKQSSANQSTC